MSGKQKTSLNGSITVFLSLTCILFLVLISAVTESARVQGAKAQSANITGLATFSLLSEFETSLLEKYEIFAIDGASGGSFQISSLKSSLEEYIGYNVSPKTGILNWLSFDPWNLSLESCEITGYTLLTDEKGEAFYQQAVAYMQKNIGLIALEELLELVNQTDEIEKNQTTYELADSNSETALEQLESALEASADSEDTEVSTEVTTDATGNPLFELAALQLKGVLSVVTGGATISSKSITLSAQPSSKVGKTGTLTLEGEYSGLTATVLFREYLVRYFSNYCSSSSSSSSTSSSSSDSSSSDSGSSLDATGATSSSNLEYELEYILGGKATDKNNLKYVVNRLLAMREGMNYVYCMSNATMVAEAGALAAALTVAVPGLAQLIQQAILLGWAYGESLVDLRILLDGGKVPLVKDSTSWKLTLENLCNLTQILKEGATGNEEGLTYQSYLRILLYVGSLEKQKMRALDLIQQTLRKEDGMSSFQVENCIVAVQTSATYRSGQVFLSLPQAILGLGITDRSFTQTASMAY